jgi:hypothetical protein
VFASSLCLRRFRGHAAGGGLGLSAASSATRMLFTAPTGRRDAARPGAKWRRVFDHTDEVQRREPCRAADLFLRTSAKRAPSATASCAARLATPEIGARRGAGGRGAMAVRRQPSACGARRPVLHAPRGGHAEPVPPRRRCTGGHAAQRHGLAGAGRGGHQARRARGRMACSIAALRLDACLAKDYTLGGDGPRDAAGAGRGRRLTTRPRTIEAREVMLTQPRRRRSAVVDRDRRRD